MKTLNTKLIVPFVITLLLTGCMPDSLTKFKKDAPKKATAAATNDTPTPVVDSSGTAITFVAPTIFSFSKTIGTVNDTTPLNVTPLLDGTLADSTVSDKFYDRCDIVTSGVDTQASTLPSGITLTECAFQGIPTTAKSVVTAFCSDGVSLDQATCEARPLVWNGTNCSLPDIQYQSAVACGAAFHKWYPVGGPVPYRVKMTFHNNTDAQVQYIYTTFLFASYKTLTALDYTQSDKIVLQVSGTGSFAAITPLLTTTATVGAYPRASMIASNAAVLGVSKIVDPTLSLIGINKLIPIKVASTTPFIVNTFITKKSDATQIGRIFKIDTSNRILYVENISGSNKTFLKSDLICSNSITGVCGTSYSIIDISETYTFKKDQTLDNDSQYYTERFKVVAPYNVYEVGSAINPIHPITSSNITTTNGITYSISPALPCNNPLDPSDCVSLDPDTGIISGTFSSYLSNTEFTVTATNPISSVASKVNLGAIVGPGDFSLTNKQIITVSSTAPFLAGETIYQPITPPLTEALNAKIVKVLNSYQLAIETFNGEFLPGASLDNNGSAYKSEKASIIPFDSCTNTFYTTKVSCETALYAWAPSASIHYSMAITTNTTGQYAAGDTVNSLAGTGAGANALVAHVFKAANDILFVQYLTGTNTSTSGAKTFYEGDTLDFGSLVTQVEATNMKFTIGALVTIPAPVTDTDRFIKGSDIVTSANTAAYLYNVNGSVLFAREISKAAGATLFKAGQTVYNHESGLPLATNSAVIAANSVTFDNYFVFERGKNMTLKGNISSGNGIIYSISPALPAGLTLDTSNGTIKGSAASISARKDYVITGSNFIGTSLNVISIEVKDYFEIQEKSGAASFLLHKVGDYQNNRKCRVDSSDITSLSNGKALDIRCFLDGEEQDVYQSDIVYKAVAGAGICEYVQYSPYYFNDFSPAKSYQTSTRYPTQTVTRTGCTGVIDSGTVPTPDLCEGNYSYIDDKLPNCDEGSLTYWEESYSDTCVLTNRVQKTVLCGGSKAQCVTGPVRDVFPTDAEIKTGYRSQIYPSITGTEKTYTHVAPLSKGDSNINVRHANGTIANQCSSSATDTLAWKAKAIATKLVASPMGADSNPFYTFTCLNAAYEIKARIRVIVRDWDETFRINSSIDNQSYLAPASQMNNAGNDPIFNQPFNNLMDWDNATNVGAAPTFTGGSCGTHVAGSCTNVNTIFESDAQCTNVGGTVNTSASCSGAGTSKVTCEYNSKVWTNTLCTFANQYQCELYGGTWTGDEEYKFPESLLGH